MKNDYEIQIIMEQLGIVKRHVPEALMVEENPELINKVAKFFAANRKYCNPECVELHVMLPVVKKIVAKFGYDLKDTDAANYVSIAARAMRQLYNKDNDPNYSCYIYFDRCRHQV